MTREITVTLRILTPLFSRGADDATAELRAESIKGLLRFWYRALHPTQPPDEEFRIFGIGGDKGGQALFRLDVGRIPPVEGVGIQPDWSERLAYLGRGPIAILPRAERDAHQLRAGRGVRVERAWFRPDREFQLLFRFRPRAREADMRAVLDALWALCTFGGIGARSRRGFGSVQISKVDPVAYGDIVQVVPDVDALIQQIQARFAAAATKAMTLPDHSAFSDDSRLLISPTKATWSEALHEAGQRMLTWRGWPRAGSPGAGRFVNDHNIMDSFLRNARSGGQAAAAAGLKSAPERLIFGLPHNYFFSSHAVPNAERNATVDAVDASGGELGRRGSPLHISVARVGAGRECVVLHTLLVAEFLPPGAQIRVATKGAAVTLPYTADFAPISDYLNWLSGVATPPKPARITNAGDIWREVEL